MRRPLPMIVVVAVLALAGCGSSGDQAAYQEVPGQPATLATDDGANQLAPSATPTASSTATPTPTATTTDSTGSTGTTSPGTGTVGTTGGSSSTGSPTRSAGDSSTTDSSAGSTTTQDDSRQADSGSQQALNDFCNQNPGAC